VIDLIGGKTILPKRTLALEDRLLNLLYWSAKQFALHCSAADGIIPRNETEFSCEETVPNSGESHPAMRHGLASRGIQHVPGAFSDPAGRARLDQQFSARQGRCGACGAAFGDSAPGSWELVSGLLLRQEVNPWHWVVLGWVGTLLVGSQVIKLITAGVHLIYGDREGHSFLGRQLRGLLLFSVAVVAWLVGVALSLRLPLNVPQHRGEGFSIVSGPPRFPARRGV
jgi:hypothetical protein